MFGFTDAHPLWPTIRPYLPHIARDIRRMHDAGIVHNDFHGGNILVTPSCGAYSFSYIDLNRARIHPQLTLQQRMNDLVRFALNEKDQQAFLQDYWSDQTAQLHRLFRRALEKRVRLLARRACLQRRVTGML
ncbi:MAG TPA: lipopolysaccharide kinase InaA family protein [Armatimonadota bacterium]|jgi:tRNA A-37 threonylcarbamoyl transferase component Bud32